MKQTDENKSNRKLGKLQRGFTLLEYCAGAAVILVTVWIAMKNMGSNTKDMIDAVGDWAKQRTEEIKGSQGIDK